MGEFADDALDAAWNSDYDVLQGDYDFDDGEFESMPPRHKKAEQPKTCKRCGQHGLHWEKVLGGWRLFNSHGEIHSC